MPDTGTGPTHAALNNAADGFGPVYHEPYDWMADEGGVAAPGFVSHRPGHFLR